MRKSDIVELISMARAFDDRIEEVAEPYPDPEDTSGNPRMIEDARLSAWHMILGDVDVELAARGLADLYQEPQMMRLQPGHIYQAALKVRRRNLAAVDPSRLSLPEGLDNEDGTTRSAEWMQRAVDALGRGASIEDAEHYADHQLKVTRRMVGPAVRHLAIEEVPRGMTSGASQMGRTA